MMALTTKYPLRTMIYLAQNDDAWPISGTRIAADTGISRKYLSRILGDLVRTGVLDASPGKGGGFRMVRSPKQIHLYEVFAPFEPVLGHRRPCLFGNDACNDDQPCLGHERWRRVRDAYSQFLHGTSVHDVAVADRRGGSDSSRKRTKR